MVITVEVSDTTVFHKSEKNKKKGHVSTETDLMVVFIKRKLFQFNNIKNCMFNTCRQSLNLFDCKTVNVRRARIQFMHR